MIKTIIFDNNGVLTLSDAEASISNFADYFHVSKIEIEKIFNNLSKPLDRGDISTNDFYLSVANSVHKNFDYQEIRKMHLQSYQPKLSMHKFAKKLRSDFEVVLLTNFGDAFDEANEKIWHLDDIFNSDRIFVSSKIGMRKPDINIYKYVLEKIKKEPEECVFIDDREANLIAPKNLGIKTILFHTREQCENELKLLLEKENGKK